MKSGIVVVNKGEGLTSQAVVNRVKRIFGVKKAGHTGTLDPMATGVLPVMIERGVKAGEYMLSSDKHYVATLLLGMTTDTEDITGKTLSRSDKLPSEDEVLRVIDSFVGEYMQTPPMYSALKIGGKKLCDLAREGVVLDREPRAVRIYSLDARKISDSEYLLDVKCSKGTYIRTLCADIGAALCVGGVMKTLCRASACGFTLEQAHSLEELEQMTDEERESVIVPTERVFEKFGAVTLSDFYARLARCGAEIYLSRAGVDAKLGERLRLYDKNGFFAIGEVREFEQGLALKPIKQFDL